MLLYPLVWVYHAIAGRSGIVLFVRHVHLLVAAVRRRAASASAAPRRGAGGHGVRGGPAAFTFVPFDIPSVSYDSLGSGLFTAGTLLGSPRLGRPGRPVGGALPRARRVRLPAVDPRGRRELRAAAVAHARQRRAEALQVTRPRWGSRWSPSPRSRLVAGPHQIITDYRRSSHYLGQAGGLTKLHGIAAHLKDTLPLWYLLAAGLLLLAWSWSRWPRIAWPRSVALLPLTTLPTAPTSYAASLNFVAHAGWLALPLLSACARRAGAVELSSPSGCRRSSVGSITCLQQRQRRRQLRRRLLPGAWS